MALSSFSPDKFRQKTAEQEWHNENVNCASFALPLILLLCCSSLIMKQKQKCFGFFFVFGCGEKLRLQCTQCTRVFVFVSRHFEKLVLTFCLFTMSPCLYISIWISIWGCWHPLMPWQTCSSTSCQLPRWTKSLDRCENMLADILIAYKKNDEKMWRIFLF